MPNIETGREPFAEALTRALFMTGFMRSKKGNLWRRWQGTSLTVFARKDGKWSWVIVDESGPKFSRHAYAEKDDALAALFRAVQDF
jgi:hypothetical protein